MNQLTVMLNGNGPNGPHQSHAPSQFFTFAGQPTMNTQGAATITLDHQQQHQQTQQLGATHQPQLVTFQSQPQAGTMMLSTTAGSQAYSGAQPGMTHQTQGAIQYFITQPQQPTQQQILAPTQSQFGIVQNLLAASGMGGMIPMNQSLATNGTIQIPTQTLMAPNGTLQQSFVTMAPNQQTFQIQNQATGTTQLFQQPQFQLQSPSLAGSAISFTNPTGQIVNGPGGQQFVLNQTISPAGAQTNNLITTNQSQAPIYQFVLPNGQVIHTMQPNTANTLISPQLMQSNQGVQQQPTAITVPIQTTQNGQTMNILTAPNLTLTPSQTTTHFITQPNASNMQNANSSTILTSHQSPNLQSHQNGLVITTPSSNSTTQQSLILNTSPQIHHQASNQQTLLIPASSAASVNNSQQSNNNTTAMVVLTQSNNAVMPNAVLDQKSIHHQQQSSPQQQAVLLLTSPKARGSPSQTLVGAKLAVHSSSTLSTASSDAGKMNANGQAAAPSHVTKVAVLPKTKVKPIPCDQSTQCDNHPQITKILESIAEEDESQSSENTQENPTSIANTSPSEPERPSRPSSASSCGSLKIAEDEVAEEEEEEEEVEREDNDTENNDAFSTETEVDNSPVNDAEIEQNSQSASDEVNEPAAETILSKQAKGKLAEDKEGYQSSYGSPCHFTDTEDEEEEETELGNGETMDGDQEIKLVRKNGLTKAAYDLINNRLLGSDCGEDQTTNDSKSSFTSGGADRMDDEEEEASNDSNAFRQTPSPSGSNASAQMEPESTTHSWAAVKEKTITNIPNTPDTRFYNGIDLEPIRKFAKEFKKFRLNRGLTQSQVCHDLSLKTDGQSYSQSAICRFEKLDITPKSAIKIKPVLENWLRASKEKYPQSKMEINSESSLADSIKESPVFANFEGFSDQNSKCSNNSEDEAITSLSHCVSLEPSRKRKKRTSFTPEQLDALNHFFEKTPKPSSEEMTEIARILASHDPKINRDVVRVWFCNKRQALKTKKPNHNDPPTPPIVMAYSPEGTSSGRHENAPKTTGTYSVPQPLGPIEAPKLVGLSASTGINANLLASTGALTFPFSSPVSAIPLALSSASSTSATVPKNTIIRTSLPPMSQSAALNLAHLKPISTPIITSFTPGSHGKTSTITTFKMERSE